MADRPSDEVRNLAGGRKHRCCQNMEPCYYFRIDDYSSQTFQRNSASSSRKKRLQSPAWAREAVGWWRTAQGPAHCWLLHNDMDCREIFGTTTSESVRMRRIESACSASIIAVSESLVKCTRHQSAWRRRRARRRRRSEIRDVNVGRRVGRTRAFRTAISDQCCFPETAFDYPIRRAEVCRSEY